MFSVSLFGGRLAGRTVSRTAKNMPKVAALFGKRSHARTRVQIIDTANLGTKLMEFQTKHGIAHLKLDDITLLMFMLSTRAYALGISWICPWMLQWEEVTETQLFAYYAIRANPALSQHAQLLCALLSLIVYGTPTDEAGECAQRDRSASLLPINVLRRMTLDEVKALAPSGMCDVATAPATSTLAGPFDLADALQRAATDIHE